MKNKLKGVIIFNFLIILFLSGCATTSTVQYSDPTSIQALSTDFSSTDLQQVVVSMVDSLLVFPPIVQITKERRPVISVSKIKNKTMQHIDTEAITDSIRTKLIRSGKFRFIDRSTDQETIEEIQIQQDSGLVNKNTMVQFGNQIGAEFLLVGNIAEIEQRNSKYKDVYYKITINLKNLSTGILEWSDEKEIRKTRKKPTFGY